jgi:catechol 2,3-dioxygenase-like lactoylglutathione lyase family enzyme
MEKADDENSQSKLNGLVETALFVEDLSRACNFYEQILGLQKVRLSDRGCVFRVSEQRYFLLVERDAAHTPNKTASGEILPPVALPEHESRGPGHVAFGISKADVDHWRTKLAKDHVEILRDIEWETGARSLYFRDPDGHMIELASPGIWEPV